MDENTQTADSTALLEPSQEIEANVVTEEAPPKEGGENISLSELTAQLLAKDEKAEAEEAAAEDTVVETEPEAQGDQVVEEQEQLTQTADEDTDKAQILQQYGIDLDSLGEEEAMTLGRALRTESMKRFGKLTAQKREAEAALKELESKAGSGGNQNSPGPQEDKLSDIWTEETLAKKEQELQEIEDWVEDALQREPQYNDDGQEYLAEVDGIYYGKSDLQGFRSNARKALRKGGAIEKRRIFLHARQQLDANALQYFPWMSDENSSEFAKYREFVQQDKYKKLLDGLPEANVVAGLLVEGNGVVEERMKAQGNGDVQASPAPKQKPIAPATANSAAPKRVGATESSRLRKQVDAAQKNFETTGSIQSLARLRELQAQMNSS